MTGNTTSQQTLEYGTQTINYSLLLSDRKSLCITVHPDSTVIIKAPLTADTAAIEKKIRKRARWIVRQLDYFSQFQPQTPKRRYISGESHLYLGKQYRLKVMAGTSDTVRLSQGFFFVTCNSSPTPFKTERLLKNWYEEKAHIHFLESLERCWEKLRAPSKTKPRLAIRAMKHRWGSLANKGLVTLNTDLIKAPKECIDYVVIHELCHLRHNNHSTEFYKLLESVIPEWQSVKHKLELRMA